MMLTSLSHFLLLISVAEVAWTQDPANDLGEQPSVNGVLCSINSDLHNYLVPAIIVTGGSVGTSVEALHGDGSPWCSLPTLPDVRSEHTQVDGV